MLICWWRKRDEDDDDYKNDEDDDVLRHRWMLLNKAQRMPFSKQNFTKTTVFYFTKKKKDNKNKFLQKYINCTQNCKV